MLEFVIDKIFAMFGGRVLQQTTDNRYFTIKETISIIPLCTFYFM